MRYGDADTWLLCHHGAQDTADGGAYLPAFLSRMSKVAFLTLTSRIYLLQNCS